MLLGAFDRNVVDGGVNGAGWFTRFMATLSVLVGHLDHRRRGAVGFVPGEDALLPGVHSANRARAGLRLLCGDRGPGVLRLLHRALNIWTSILLSIILLTPLAGLAVLLFIPANSKELIRVWANLVGFAGFLISLPLVARFELGHPGYQFEERATWIPALGANYHIGIDGISLLLIMLTTVMGFIAILCLWNAIQDRVKEYYAMFLLLADWA